ncbi:nuclear transport factor 2 family protein [Hymenobacter jeollabukensis]|uniref:Nuclear transport factor 2 family protein n=1 Tax=Hymenobacter jeollabukensis TaxID=2025313 RepID=A0A5R8WP04_9BACT|nr:nuclear transport factor 2 family protein [Hymenobacter jeollabukensis]TLM91775.1 nuclear transport factor 2 family protein [Hymenobacter jeollabukensis]
MRLLLLPCLLLAAPAALAQTNAAATPPAETEAVKATVTRFFEGLRKGDSAVVRSTLAPTVVLHTISTRGGNVQVINESPKEFLKAVGTPHKDVWDERISFERVLIDAQLASVWTPYQFYAGATFSHCGYNSFQLVKLPQGWRIAYVIDTRRKDGCK